MNCKMISIKDIFKKLSLRGETLNLIIISGVDHLMPQMFLLN